MHEEVKCNVNHYLGTKVEISQCDEVFAAHTFTIWKKRDTLVQKYLGRACSELGDSSSLESNLWFNITIEFVYFLALNGQCPFVSKWVTSYFLLLTELQKFLLLWKRAVPKVNWKPFPTLRRITGSAVTIFEPL